MTMNCTTLIADKTTAGSIKNWMNAGDVDPESILTEAQAWIYRKLRVRQMLQTATGTLTANTDSSISLPTNYRAAKHLFFPGGASTPKITLIRKSIEEMRAIFAYDGSGNLITSTPRFWATDASLIQLDVITSYAYPYNFLYYGSLAALAASSNETNFLTDEYPRLLRAACLMIGYEWKKNGNQQTYYLKIAMGEIGDANVEDDQEKEGTDLQMHIGA